MILKQAHFGKWLWHFANEWQASWKKNVSWEFCIAKREGKESLVVKVWSGSDGWLWKEIMNNFTKFVKEIWFQGRVLMGLLPLINPPFQRNSGSIWDCFQTFKAWLERMSCGRRSPGIWTPAFVKISNI